MLYCRWASRLECVNSIISQLPALLTFVKDDLLAASNPPEAATRLYEGLTDFKVLGSLHLFADLLDFVDQVQRCFQFATVHFDQVETLHGVLHGVLQQVTDRLTAEFITNSGTPGTLAAKAFWDQITESHPHGEESYHSHVLRNVPGG